MINFGRKKIDMKKVGVFEYMLHRVSIAAGDHESKMISMGEIRRFLYELFVIHGNVICWIHPNVNFVGKRKMLAPFAIEKAIARKRLIVYRTHARQF